MYCTWVYCWGLTSACQADQSAGLILSSFDSLLDITTTPKVRGKLRTPLVGCFEQTAGVQSMKTHKPLSLFPQAGHRLVANHVVKSLLHGGRYRPPGQQRPRARKSPQSVSTTR
jgi:hypothetical protein